MPIQERSESQVFYLHGMGASSGNAAGIAVVLPDVDDFIPVRESLSVAEERGLFQEAVVSVLQSLAELGEHQPESIQELLHVQELFLRDPQFLEEVDHQLQSGLHAASALHRALKVLEQRFTESANEFYRQRWIDFEDAGRSVLDVLIGVSYTESCLAKIKAATGRPVIVAVDLSAAMYLKMAKPAAIVLREGGPSSHLSLLAANQGIPILVRTGPSDRFHTIQDGNWIEMRGETIAVYESPQLRSSSQAATDDVQSLEDKRTSSTILLSDGRAIELSLNADDSDTIRLHAKHHRISVGLFRTEFLYLRHTELIFDEDKAAAAYADVIDASGEDGVVTFRLLDVDEDKFSAHFFSKPAHRGLRGVDYYRAESKIFESQLRSLFRAGLQFTHHNFVLRIMAPMIRTPEDWQYIRLQVQKIQNELSYNGSLQLGMMIEIPSALFSMNSLQKSVDFFSLGTNDLLRYVIGKSRSQPSADDWYEPSFFRLLFHGLRNIHSEISICGMMASKIEFLPLLLDLGITHFSVPLGSYNQIRGFFENYDTVRYSDRRLLRTALRLQSRSDIRNLLHQYG